MQHVLTSLSSQTDSFLNLWMLQSVQVQVWGWVRNRKRVTGNITAVSPCYLSSTWVQFPQAFSDPPTQTCYLLRSWHSSQTLYRSLQAYVAPRSRRLRLHKGTTTTVHCILQLFSPLYILLYAGIANIGENCSKAVSLSNVKNVKRATKRNQIESQPKLPYFHFLYEKMLFIFVLAQLPVAVRNTSEW